MLNAKHFSLAIAFTAVATFLLPQSAVAQSSPVGTWDSDQDSTPDCPVDFIEIHSDGSAKIIVIIPGDKDGGYYQFPATWTLSGADFSINNQDMKQTLTGLLSTDKLQLTNIWTADDGAVHRDACTFGKD